MKPASPGGKRCFPNATQRPPDRVGMEVLRSHDVVGGQSCVRFSPDGARRAADHPRTCRYPWIFNAPALLLLHRNSRLASCAPLFDLKLHMATQGRFPRSTGKDETQRWRVFQDLGYAGLRGLPPKCRRTSSCVNRWARSRCFFSKCPCCMFPVLGDGGPLICTLMLKCALQMTEPSSSMPPCAKAWPQGCLAPKSGRWGSCRMM